MEATRRVYSLTLYYSLTPPLLLITELSTSGQGPILLSRRTSPSAKVYFLQKDNWIDLFKAWEVVRDAAGRARKGTPKGNHKDILAVGWADETEQWRFTATAQVSDALGVEARHAGKRKYAGPGNEAPMTIDAARQFIGSLIDAWVKQIDGTE